MPAVRPVDAPGARYRPGVKTSESTQVCQELNGLMYCICTIVAVFT
jgi:hypothetical protein